MSEIDPIVQQGIDEPFFRDHRVFRDALEQQNWINAQSFTDFAATDKVLHDIAETLDDTAKHEQMHGETVTLTGPNIFVPRLSYEPHSGVPIITSRKAPVSIDNLYEPPCYTGTFQGFTYILPVELADDEETIHAIRPQLHYQISPDEMSGAANFLGAICTHAAIETTAITFLPDTQRDDAVTALNVLRRPKGGPHQLFVDALEDALAQEEVKAEDIQRSAKLIRTFLDTQKADISNTYKDAILDFVRARIGLYANRSFVIESADALVTPSTGPNNKKLIKDLQVVEKVADLTFSPQYQSLTTTDGHTKLFVSEDEHAIAIAVSVPEDTETAAAVVFIPLEKITMLLPS